MTKRQLRRAAALLDQWADMEANSETCADGTWSTSKFGKAAKRSHDELRKLAEALRKEADHANAPR